MQSFNCKYIDDYIAGIKSGRINHPKDVELFIDNILIPVLERDDIYIDNDAIEKGLSLQKYFPYKLVDWELFQFALIVGVIWQRESDYEERWFNYLADILGRGTGKNGFISFLAFYFLSPYNGINGYNVDIIANSEDQSKTSFDDVYNVIKTPVNKKYEYVLSKNYYATKTKIKGVKTNSILRFNTSSNKGKDSKRTGALIMDEYHEYEKGDNIKTLKSGLGKVKNHIEIIITTDGNVRGGEMDKLKSKCASLLNQKNPNCRSIIFYWHIEDESEWNDIKALEKANPSLAHPTFRTLRDTILDEIAEMPENMDYYPTFLAKRCNYPIGNKEVEVTSWENNKACNRPLPDLRGCSCVGGIDYSKTNDFVGVGLLFYQSGMWYWLHHTFVCARSRDLLGIKAPIKEWAAAGDVTIVDDVEIHPSVIAGWFADRLAEGYNILNIAIDSYRYTLLTQALKNIGFDAVDNKNITIIRPSNLMMIAPTINSVFINQLLAWGDAPIMNWCTNNVKCSRDKKDNIIYGKIEPARRKTDTFMAMTAAFAISEMLIADNSENVPEVIVF